MQIDDGGKKQNYTKWTDAMKHALAHEVSVKRAYIKTSDAKLRDKWKSITEVLQARPEFINCPPLSWETVKAQWKRIQDSVRKEAAVDNRYTNLSAMHYEPTEYQKLVLNMLEETDAAALNLKEKKSNNDRVQAALFTHEQQELEMQGQLTSDPILLVPENFDSPPENYQDLNEEGFELKRHSTPSTPGSKRRLKNPLLSSRKLERRHLQSYATSN